MNLNDLDLSFALGAVENLAFLYFFFVDVNLDRTFRTPNHSPTSRTKDGSREQAYYITLSGPSCLGRSEMSNREYPEHPLVGVGGVVIDGERALLARRGREPMRGEWSIPGGLLEVGESLAEGVMRELHEETGLTVRVLDLIEALDRILPDSAGSAALAGTANEPRPRPRYHYVILDYLCEIAGGELRAGGDITEVAFLREEELPRYALTPAVIRVVSKAFAMARARAKR
jgi:8-oxo-dGTP diphosphatase